MTRHRWRVPVEARAFIVLLCAFVLGAGCALADDHTDTRSDVRGTVTSRDGTPIAGARVTLSGEADTLHAQSKRDGRFKLKDVRPGTYVLTVSAPGFNTISGRPVEIGGHEATLALVMDPATTSSLTVIGEVASNAGPSIGTSSAPTVSVNAQSAAAQGTAAVSEMLWGQIGTTPTIPLGGGSNAAVSIAVRGPDPTETLVDVDGHQVNNGNTGDFDLSLIDPADLAAVQVVYGIAPSSLVGPNTLGGAVNVVTLQPASTPSALIRGFLGSFGTTGQTLQATGTSGHFGYAASLHRATSLGSVNESVVNSEGGAVTVGSNFFGETMLSKLRYQLGDGYGFLQASVRTQAVNKDLSALLTNYTPPAFDPGGSGFETFAGTSLASHQANYGFDAVLPLSPEKANPPSTVLSFSHLTTIDQQSVNGPGAQTSPYLYDQNDLLGDDWLQLEHHFGAGNLALKYDIATENLTTQYVPNNTHADVAIGGMPGAKAAGPSTIPLAQTQRSLVLRYDANAGNRLHYSVAAYDSDFSVFGHRLDPRAGLVWTPTARTGIRASVGTTFQAPQLTSLYVPPVLPSPVAGVVYVGNPNLRPDFATEYDLGLEQIFGKPGAELHLSADVYRTNIRSAINVPAPPLPPPHCEKNRDCPIVMPINAGDNVYRGIELRAEQQLGAQFRLHAGWDVGSSYLSTVSSQVQDGTLVPGQQILGEPLHKAYFGFARDVPQGLTYGADVNWEGWYNELNRPPFATLDAHVAYRTGRFEIGAYGTNLTNAYANPFTVVGAGVAYGSLPGTPVIPTNAYVLQGAKLVVVVTQKL